MPGFTAELIPPRINAGIILCSWVNVTLGAYASFALLARVNMRSQLSLRKAAIIFLAATCITLGSWTCQLMSSRFSLASTRDITWIIPFNPGFIVLAILAPLCITCVAFLVSVSAFVRPIWLACVSGCCVGLSIGLMHFTLYLSLGRVVAVHSSVQSTGAFLLFVTSSFLAFLAMLVFQAKWEACICLRMLVPSLFGVGICGATFLSLSGTDFFINNPANVASLAALKHNWDRLTLVVPISISAILACLIASLTIVDIAKPRLLRPKPSQLSVVCLSFTADGRILIQEDGSIPHERVDLDGIYEGLLHGLRCDRDLFQWLYTLSFDWSLFASFEGQVRDEINAKKRSSFLPFSKACIPFIDPFLNPTSLLKRRILESIVRLADDLDIPISEVGYLYDTALPTGTDMNLTEFLHLSQHDGDLRDLESASGASRSMHHGYMIFFVRNLPRTESKPGDDWARKYAPRGYRLSHLLRVRDYLVESTGAAQDAVDRILLRSRDYRDYGTKAIVQPESTHLALFASRGITGVSEEVLVYDKAKHQIPICNIVIKTFTADMRSWVNNAGAITAGELLELCRGRSIRKQPVHSFNGTSRRNTCKPLAGGDESSSEQFQEALANSLEHILSELSFIDNLAFSARLCPTVMDVPCSEGASAQLILLHVELPEPSKSVDLHQDTALVEIDDPNQTSSTSPAKASITYVPMSFFEVSRACVYGITDHYARGVERDMARLFATSSSRETDVDPTSENNDRRPYRNASALVSSFSIDTVSDIDSQHVIRNNCSLSSVRSWASSAVTVIMNTAAAGSSIAKGKHRASHSSSANRSIANTHMIGPSDAGPSSPRTFSFLPSIHSSSELCAGRSPVGPSPSIIDEDGPIVTSVRAPIPQIRLPPPLRVVTSMQSSAFGRSTGTGTTRRGGRYSCESSCLTAHTPLFESMFPASPHDSFRRNEWKRSDA